MSHAHQGVTAGALNAVPKDIPGLVHNHKPPPVEARGRGGEYHAHLALLLPVQLHGGGPQGKGTQGEPPILGVWSPPTPQVKILQGKLLLLLLLLLQQVVVQVIPPAEPPPAPLIELRLAQEAKAAPNAHVFDAQVVHLQVKCEHGGALNGEGEAELRGWHRGHKGHPEGAPLCDHREKVRHGLAHEGTKGNAEPYGHAGRNGAGHAAHGHGQPQHARATGQPPRARRAGEHGRFHAEER